MTKQNSRGGIVRRAAVSGLAWVSEMTALGAPPAPVATPAAPTVRPPPALVWDAMSQEYTANADETTNLFTFSATNRSKSVVVIAKLTPSCGCTVAQLPAEPWRLEPGANGQVRITISFAGKYGLVTKFIRVDGWDETVKGSQRETNRFEQTLVIKVHMPELVEALDTGSATAFFPDKTSSSVRREKLR